jgi:hypothetical protein
MSKQVKGIAKLNAMVEKLKEAAEEVRENWEEKSGWLDDKSEKYQEGPDGEEWSAHLGEVENLLEAIEYLDPLDL